MFPVLGMLILLAVTLAASGSVTLATTQSDPPRDSGQSFGSPLNLEEVINLIKKARRTLLNFPLY